MKKPKVVDLAAQRERRRIRANARAFMQLPEAERRRQLREMIEVRIENDPPPTRSKGDGSEK